MVVRDHPILKPIRHRQETAPMTRTPSFAFFFACALFLGATAAHAATDEQKCQAAKNKAASKYAGCRANAEAKLVTSGDAAKHTAALANCASKFTTAWQKLETKAVDAGTTCPSVGDAVAIESTIRATTDTVAVRLEGTRFLDNGDGTVTDTQTGLQWEQKTTVVGSGNNPADPHDVDNTYTWSIVLAGEVPDGTLFTDFLHQLNSCSTNDGTALIDAGFAGHCDWRLPTIQELKTIVDLTAPGCGIGSPCIDPVFGPTVPFHSWSGTTRASNPADAWTVLFNVGSTDTEFKSNGNALPVRAVRRRS
jgi:hypothetical protein